MTSKYGREVIVFDKAKGHNVVIGYFDGTTFTKIVKPNHFVHQGQGWATDYNEFNKMKSQGLKLVVVREGKNIWRSDIATWDAHGFTRDLKHGEQLILGQKWMKRDGDEIVFASEKKKPKPEEPQMSFLAKKVEI